MARPLRIEFPGALYHVTARGNARADIFLDGHDRDRFLHILAKVIGRYAWICHAYCLMGNHHHLLIETPRPNLAAGMRQLNGTYAQCFNARHGRTGHVFGGRYKAVVVEKNAHLVRLAAYIVCNPVRAGWCRRPEEWRHSSYRATAGYDSCPLWLSTDWLLSQFGKDLQEAQRRYREYVLASARAEVPGVRGEIYFGDDDFINRLAPNRPLREVPRPQWQPLRPPLHEVLSSFDEQALEVAHRRFGYTLREIAVELGVHYSTVGRRLAAHEKHAATQDLTPGGPASGYGRSISSTR